MSVTSSSATVGRPPLLFGQRSPSPPSFASPPQTHTQVASPPEHIHDDDVDMSASLTLPPPDGQNHDREADALMLDPDTLADGHAETTPAHSNSSEPPASGVAVQVAAVEDDAMDTSPDNSQDLVLPNGSVGLGEAPGVTERSHAPVQANGQEPAQDEAVRNETPPPPPTDLVPTETDTIPPVEPPPPVDPSLQPPPPPPEPVRSDSDSSDDDDGHHPWHPLHEDTSVPDEAEMKEIEACEEHSALDHDYWWKKATPHLPDPEHTLGARGIIEWKIDNYNGTRENPNKDLVMKSEPVTIGGYEWQIKFYPKGNNTDYLSIYIECVSVEDKSDSDMESVTSHEDAFRSDDMAADQTKTASTADTVELQHAPLPLLDSMSVPKRKSIAAQISVVLWNPDEPRTNHFRTCGHRFCGPSPDWGWTRYHGPYIEIPYRVRGQRQALLRGDKLAFTGFVQIVEDETGCMWEHATRESPWDSFAMTGLQSLAMGETPGRERAPSGGNLISAIASWMLFKPFRKLLYSVKVPDPDHDPFARPKPLLAALQKVLFMLRTQVKHAAGPVFLEDVLDALDWYGIIKRFNKLDVMGVWELLRIKLEDELRDTQHADVLQDLFGMMKDYNIGRPSYRAPVMGVNSMQEAVNQAGDLLSPLQPLPQLLTVELDRQDFDYATRSYVKLMNKVTLDDHIKVRQTPYTLLGFIVHQQGLQSYRYHPVIRPEGPGSKWYSYTDGRDENLVKCLTEREAVREHEGKPGSGKITGNDPIAYIALYVRADIADSTFNSPPEPEQWDVPEWIREQSEKEEIAPVPAPPEEDAPSSTETQPNSEGETLPAKSVEFRVINSKAFLEHEGPGFFDAYDPKLDTSDSELVTTVQLESRDGLQDIRNKLAASISDIKDPRQIKFWFMEPTQGSFGLPNLHGTGQVEYSSGSTARYMDQSKEWTLEESPDYCASYWLWVHVVDVADLPELPKEEPKVAESEPANGNGSPVTSNEPQNDNASTVVAVPDSEIPQVDDPAAELRPTSLEPEWERHSEDTPMSDPDEPDEPDERPQPDVDTPTIDSPTAPAGVTSQNAHDQDHHVDTPMVEVEEVAVSLLSAADPPAVEVVISGTSVPAFDIEMGGTHPYMVPPPPLFGGSHTELPPQIPPPPDAVMEEPPPDEIYFFLKMFDAQSQTLRSYGSHIALRSAKIDSTVVAAMSKADPAGFSKLKPDIPWEIVEEVDLTSTRPLRTRRSFATNDLQNTAVIIVSQPLSEEEDSVLADKGAFAQIDSFLAFRAQARYNPRMLNGHFTKNYFSAQYYKGEIKNGQRHGHGTRIYHSGATYVGSFRCGQRHGHGLYTFQNGDTYDGDWVANQQHGSGTFVEAATGNKYVGDWKNDKKFGEGVTHWKKAQEAERLCRICWCENADTAFVDCGHVVACLGCAKQMNTCPVCRKRVISAMKLYYVA